MWNLDFRELNASDDIKQLVDDSRRSIVDNKADATHITYECLLSPSVGILNCPQPLLPGCELKLSFDRAKAALSLMNFDDQNTTDEGALQLKNLCLKANYVSSPFLRNFFATIDDTDIKYPYDECTCYLKNLPQGETIIRLSNVIGGLTPRYVFCGVIQSDALNGDYDLSSTRFQRHGVTELDLSINGYSCNGFPIQNTNGSALPAYTKWLQSTNRAYKNNCAEMINPLDFKRFHFIYSHKFDGELTEQGWLGIDIKLEKAYEKNYILGDMIAVN